MKQINQSVGDLQKAMKTPESFREPRQTSNKINKQTENEILLSNPFDALISLRDEDEISTETPIITVNQSAIDTGSKQVKTKNKKRKTIRESPKTDNEDRSPQQKARKIKASGEIELDESESESMYGSADDRDDDDGDSTVIEKDETETESEEDDGSENVNTITDTKQIIIMSNQNLESAEIPMINKATRIQRITHQNHHSPSEFRDEIEQSMTIEERDAQDMIVYNMNNNDDEINNHDYHKKAEQMISEIHECFNNATVIVAAMPPINESLESSNNKKIKQDNSYIERIAQSDIRTIFVNSWDVLTKEGTNLLYDETNSMEISIEGRRLTTNMWKNAIENCDDVMKIKKNSNNPKKKDE